MLVIKHYFKTLTEKPAIQMSSLELCNWLVISLLSFLCVERIQMSVLPRGTLNKLSLASTALMLIEVMPPPLQLMLE